MDSLSHVQAILLIFLFVPVHSAYNLDYSELQAMGVACPERDKCAGYKFNSHFLDRNCECDSDCATYKDCCIDANRMRSSVRTVVPRDYLCLNYSEDNHTGIYVVAQCSSSWNGQRQVREKCEGDLDFSDPVGAAPVTSVAEALTYKNLFCAECNNANMQSLTTFQFVVLCDGLEYLSQEQIKNDLFYNQEQTSWGINRLYSDGSTNFLFCDITFEVPDYINASVRFCRSNVISECARDWSRRVVRTRCEEYMAVVYEKAQAYRNPHCAICNHKTVSKISCKGAFTGKRRPISLAERLDINMSYKEECSSDQIYDPFIKQCRKLVCALPGSRVVNGKCVRGGS